MLLAVMALASVSCVDDLVDSNTPTAASGDEVQFGLSLSGPETRTIYGPEGQTSFPIYWVNGDKVKVYSPSCLEGRNNAEYQVTVPSGSTQNYAEKLTPTGATGVQWGTEGNATFYSIYPSANTTISGEEGSVTASLKIPFTQSLTHTLVDGVYYAADMSSVIMYAKTTASKTDQAVNLKYIPYSTVIEFELNGDFSKNANASIFVQSLTLEAPENSNINLTGNFDFTFPTAANSNPTISNGDNSRAELKFTSQPELKSTSPKLKAKMCLIPIDGVTSLDGWTVSVTVRDGNNKINTYKLVIDETEDNTTALAAGKVHKITLPSIAASAPWTYKPENWMPQLPEYKDIYLTELSIPGAWYAGTKISQGYQNTQSFEDLWAGGVRAFGAECRAYTPRSGFLGGGDLTNTKPTRICLSGTGSAQSGAYTHQWAQEGAMIYISDVIKNIATEVSKTTTTEGKEEFAVLVLNYAYGGSGGYRQLDYDYFIQGIQNEITESGMGGSIVDASTINPSTTIGDVAGKLIIKVNVDSRVNIATPEGVTVNTLLSATPLMKDLIDKTSIYYSNILSDSWAVDDYDYTTNPSFGADDFIWCFTSENRTYNIDSGTTMTYTDSEGGILPTYVARKTVLESMIRHSSDITSKSQHNVWFYFNCGGSQTTSLGDEGSGEAFASVMNSWLLGVINRKINGYTDSVSGMIYASDPSPLGIVMFNQCTNDAYSGPTIVRAIVEMNNKAELRRITDVVPDVPDQDETEGGNV